MPSFCTSRGLRCLSTFTASSSPSDRSRIAPLLMPSSFIAGYPLLDHVCHYLWIISGQLTGKGQVLFILRELRYLFQGGRRLLGLILLFLAGFGKQRNRRLI